VPIYKYFTKNISRPTISSNLFTSLGKRAFSNITSLKDSDKNEIVKYYQNADLNKKLIVDENEGKSGIYRWTNKLTGEFYIGQSRNLSNRFKKYYSFSYLSSKSNFIISRALIKYGYSNFSVEILEYCDPCNLMEREQYYFNKLNPKYNILKVAGSSLGFKQSDKTKLLISKSLKGVYVGDKSPLFGRLHSEETKELMSLKKLGDKNSFYGKFHTEETKELMRSRKLGRVHTEETKLLMSKTHGNPIDLYEKTSSEGFNLIGKFTSARRVANFIGISCSTVVRHMRSGTLFKDRYKFTQSNNKNV
jgi:group I intron endonuclease